MWSSPDVIGLFSNNVVSFSRNVVLSGPLFSLNLVLKSRILSVRTVYVLSSLQVEIGLILFSPARIGIAVEPILRIAAEFADD
jgi:hypothetical protein